MSNNEYYLSDKAQCIQLLQNEVANLNQEIYQSVLDINTQLGKIAAGKRRLDQMIAHRDVLMDKGESYKKSIENLTKGI